jgi:hypothetical protein
VSWTGADLGKGCTLEWKVFILGTTLCSAPRAVSADVQLMRPPIGTECLVVAVVLGPTVPTSRYPRMDNSETCLLAEGRLSDGRRVWIVYAYAPAGTIAFPTSPNVAPAVHINREALAASQDGLRAFCVTSQQDGSLGFWDMRVDRPAQAETA